jgi:heat shock 70kDa protein 1/2/6/8
MQSDANREHRVENTITSHEIGMKMKRNHKSAVETELAKALEKLEVRPKFS